MPMDVGKRDRAATVHAIDAMDVDVLDAACRQVGAGVRTGILVSG